MKHNGWVPLAESPSMSPIRAVPVRNKPFGAAATSSGNRSRL
ncbi:Uncharacterised protein [Mycobacterium tuberculosis]|nr:Uncharacterised protein [Mycobacterium tuberculosis]